MKYSGLYGAVDRMGMSPAPGRTSGIYWGLITETAGVDGKTLYMKATGRMKASNRMGNSIFDIV